MRLGRSLLFTLLLLALLVAAFPVAAADQTATQTITVNAYAEYYANPHTGTLHGDPNSIWTDSGLMLKEGLPVTVTATGTAYCNATCPSTPNGNGNGIACPSYCGGPGLLEYSLIARIGTGTPFFVGTGPVTVSGAGELFFAFNDGRYDDNSGAFTVTLSYACKPGNGFGDKNHYHCGPPGQA